jgi:hypothetical protein
MEDAHEEWIANVMADLRSPAEWLQLLISTDPDARHRAKYKLGSLMPGDDHFFADLMIGACATDERARFMALVGLKRLGRFTPDLAQVVKTALRDPVQAVRQTALSLAAGFDASHDDLVKLVVSLLQSDAKVWVRCDAARAAGSLAATGAATLQHLIAATYDDHVNVRRSAVIAIKLLGPSGSAAASRMWELLRDEKDASVRSQAETALQLMGAIHG